MEEKNMNVILKIENDVYIKCDESRIEKAINNIIINGIKYSPKDENLMSLQSLSFYFRPLSHFL